MVNVDLSPEVAEAHALPRDVVERATGQAASEARAADVTGKALTPFLLARVNELTGGDSLAGNVALVRDNARLAAQIAVAYAAVSITGA
ncbi:MAG: pseudouridine-5'-phosphate glycosidase [Burkholderiales bacterium]|nr:pseudouridine-5'-phosphate glycosidase [Burkholderiales bacterium]